MVLVDLDLDIAKTIGGSRGAGLADLGADRYRPSLVLKPGDVVSITVYEVSAMPIFGANPGVAADRATSQPVGGHSATVPAQVIEQDGRVPVPFGGSVRIAGLTPTAAGRAIAEALSGQATNPQAVVSLVSSTVNTATVNGEVGRPGLVPLTVRGERVLDVIAIAGGAKYPIYDTDVQLVRNGRAAKANMQQLVADPGQNVRLRPGDSLVVMHNPRTFTVLGSASKASQYDFNVEQVTLAEAVARAGGLNDNLSDVDDIYLLRFEPRAFVDSLLRPEDPQRNAVDPYASTVPVAYHVSLREASGYFISKSVQMRDKDVVLVANAGSVQLSKLLTIVRSIAGSYYDFAVPGSRATGATSASDASTTTP